MKKSVVILNDSEQYFDKYGSDCASCAHLDYEQWACKAFPNGIPGKILSGASQHRAPVEGQKGDLVFTAIK